MNVLVCTVIVMWASHMEAEHAFVECTCISIICTYNVPLSYRQSLTPRTPSMLQSDSLGEDLMTRRSKKKCMSLRWSAKLFLLPFCLLVYVCSVLLCLLCLYLFIGASLIELHRMMTSIGRVCVCLFVVVPRDHVWERVGGHMQVWTYTWNETMTASYM